MKIQYYVRNVFGNDRRYIVNPDIASRVFALTREKTLSTVQMDALEQLGFEFEQVLDPKSK
jgi:phage gp46-like protein